jgi:PPOX class probable F420-dependent enzyme
MAVQMTPLVTQFIVAHRVARLATTDATGHPFIIPICYAFDGTFFYSAIDEKPKRAQPRQLQRIRNIESNPNVAVLIDDYSENWSELAYAVIHGVAEILDPAGSSASEHAHAVAALRLKYSQYRSMSIDRHPVIKIAPNRVRFWTASGF